MIWATVCRDQSSMRSSSMRFAPHSPESQGAWDELYNARHAERVSRSPHSRDYFLAALSTRSWLSSRGWLPNQPVRHRRPRTLSGQPSCDGAALELRVVDLIAQHDEAAH